MVEIKSGVLPVFAGGSWLAEDEPLGAVDPVEALCCNEVAETLRRRFCNRSDLFFFAMSWTESALSSAGLDESSFLPGSGSDDDLGPSLNSMK